MKPTKLIAMFGVALLVACGGGGGQMAGIDGGGTPTPVAGVVSKGTITGFGSVIVNGVHYSTNGTTFTIDDNPGTESDLAVGDVVVVRGTLSSNGTTGTATSISFDDAVEGPITAIDTVNSTITVLGQLVHIGPDTSFDNRLSPPSLDGLAVDDIVEVAGLFRADGSIDATRIEPKAAGGLFEVTGVVSGLAGTTFQINGLVVDFSTAPVISNFPNGGPENGQPVEVKGNTFNGSGQLVATRVEFKGNELAGEAGDRFEVEGFITDFVSATDFKVDGKAITTDGNTSYVNGVATDLASNRKVEVEGTLNTSGTLVARRIEFRQGGFIRIDATVEAVASDNLTLLGVHVSVNIGTRFEDKSNARVTQFDLADVNVGDYVAIRGYEDSTGIVATQLERDDPRNDVSIRGFVDTVNDPSFTILGVTINTSGGTVFRNLGGASMSSGAFFGQAAGRLVDAKGTLSNGEINAQEVQLEN